MNGALIWGGRSTNQAFAERKDTRRLLSTSWGEGRGPRRKQATDTLIFDFQPPEL